MRFVGPLRVRFFGDEAIARRYIPQARLLLGELFSTHAVPFASVSRTLPNGVHLQAQFNAQPMANDRNWATDTLSAARAGSIVAEVSISAFGVDAPNLPENQGFVLIHPNTEFLFDSDTYGIFFDEEGSLIITSPYTDRDGIFSTLEFNNLSSPEHQEVYPDKLFDGEDPISVVEWQNETECLCVLVNTTTLNVRYNAVPETRDIYRRGEVFCTPPVNGTVRGFALSEEYLYVILLDGSDIKLYRTAEFDIELNESSEVIEEWELLHTQGVPFGFTLRGCMHFNSEPSRAVGVLWNNEGDRWIEVVLSVETGFTLSDEKYNPFIGFSALTWPGTGFFGRADNFAHYSIGGTVLQGDFEDFPPGSFPGASPWPTTETTPYNSSRNGQFSYAPTVDIDDPAYEPKKLIALDFSSGTDDIVRGEIDYTSATLSAQFDASFNYTGTETITAGTFNVETEVSGSDQASTVAVLQEGDITVNGMVLGRILDIDVQQTYQMTASGESTLTGPSASSSGSSSGSLQIRADRNAIFLLALDLRHEYAAYMQLDQSFSFDVAGSASASNPTYTFSFQYDRTPLSQTMFVRGWKSGTSLFSKEFPLVDSYANLGPGSDFGGSFPGNPMSTATSAFSDVGGRNPTVLFRYNYYSFNASNPLAVPIRETYLNSDFPGWGSPLPVAQTQADSWSLESSDIRRFAYFRECIRPVFYLQNDYQLAYAARRAVCAFSFYGERFQDGGSVRAIQFDGSTLSAYFQAGAEMLYDDFIDLGVV